MLEITDYKSLFKYGDMKKIMEITGYSRYVIETNYEMTELIKTFYDKKLELLKNQIWEHQK